MKIIIAGHKQPDTDSALSSIAYAELKKKIDPKNEYIPTVCAEVNNETKYVLDYFKQDSPQKFEDIKNYEGLIVLDHTELSQASEYFDPAKVLEIIDHHRLADMQTPAQVFVRIEMLGSTSTIIAKIYFEKKIEPSKEIAGLLIAGIISDTLYLKSPTTTEEDKEILNKLNKIVQIDDLDKFAMSMFEAKSDISSLSPYDIVTKDYKAFNFSKKIGIGTWETVLPDPILDIKDKLISELNKLKEQEQVNLMYFFIVDILNHKSWMLIIGDKEKEAAEATFGGNTENNILPTGNRVSRKKEIAPFLEAYFRK